MHLHEIFDATPHFAKEIAIWMFVLIGALRCLKMVIKFYQWAHKEKDGNTR